MSDKTGQSRRAERAQRRQRQQRTRIVSGVAGAVVVAGAMVALIVVMVGDDGDDGDDGNDADETVAELDLFEFGFSGDLEMPAGPITLAATNVGGIPHNVGIRGVAISNEIAPGDSLDLDLGELAPGQYELYCDIVGHEEAGMVADFLVT
jgi:hypothetical protein